MDSPELQDILKTLLPSQLDFVQARIVTRTDKQAAEAIGISPNTVYGWDNKADVDQAVALAKQDGITIAREKLRRLASQAVDALGSELKGRRKIEAAKEILDRAGLEAGAHLDVTSGGERIGPSITDDERIERLAALFEQARERRTRHTDSAKS